MTATAVEHKASAASGRLNEENATILKSLLSPPYPHRHPREPATVAGLVARMWREHGTLRRG